MMNKIIELATTEARLGKEVNLQKAEDMLLDYLTTQPKDTQAWLLLARIECNIPFKDPERIISYANNILAYDPGNPYALLFLSYADYYICGSSDETLYSKLLRAKSDDPEMLAMLEMAKAYYWELRDSQKYMEALKRSIEYSQSQQTNYYMLGEIYIKQKKDHKQVLEGVELIKHGLSNVKVIADESTPYDPTSISDFFAEFFAGTRTSYVVYELLKNIITIDNIEE